jgi:hypothetical protein
MTDNKFSVDGSETSVQDVVSKLLFISKIKEGDIIFTMNDLEIQKKSLSTSLRRTLFERSECREEARLFFNKTINNAFNLAEEYLKRDDSFSKKIGEMIIQRIKDCLPGLHEHMKTYDSLHMHVSRISALISVTKAKLDGMEGESVEIERRE